MGPVVMHKVRGVSKADITAALAHNHFESSSPHLYQSARYFKDGIIDTDEEAFSLLPELVGRAQQRTAEGVVYFAYYQVSDAPKTMNGNKLWGHYTRDSRGLFVERTLVTDLLD